MPATISRHRKFIALLAVATTVVVACGDAGGVGPDPFRPQFYRLQFIDNQSLPFLLIQGFIPEDHTDIDSAFLIPFAVGRTLDQRLLNDRTGRGPSGGNTRDTTVARGQFMDIRILKHVTLNRPDSYQRDSLLVDVEVRDTTVILRRHINPAVTETDTGFFVGDLLVVPTVIRYALGQIIPSPKQVILSYKVTR